MNLNVKLKLSRGMEAPTYATDGSAAVDLRAALDEGTEVIIAPGERALIPTGISISPETRDVVAVIAGRSGLGIKNGVTLANGIGVIDSDYRGEFMVALHNHTDFPVTLEGGERIAQLVITPCITADFELVSELSDTARGEGGFGSTGKK